MTANLVEAVKVLGTAFNDSDEWIALLPYICILENSFSIDKRGTNFSEPAWWGAAQISTELRNLHLMSHSKR